MGGVGGRTVQTRVRVLRQALYNAQQTEQTLAEPHRGAALQLLPLQPHLLPGLQHEAPHAEIARNDTETRRE